MTSEPEEENPMVTETDEIVVVEDGSDPEAIAIDPADRADPDATTVHDGRDPIVRFRHVSRWYGEVNAVNDVDADIGAGITGLLGPNGAGKSTFLRMVVGLQRPSQGEVTVFGAEPWDEPDVLGRIGYVPEAPAPWRDRSGREAALRAAQLAGLAPDEAGLAADQALQRVGLAEDAHRHVSEYSQGMKQRLKFALALIGDPDLYVFDEPLLGTDPLARRDLIRLMKELGDEGKTILLSTHVLRDVEALTQRVIIMDHGRILAQGEVSEIRDLLERHPRRVRIETPDPRGVGGAIWTWDTVLSVARDGDALTVLTDRPADFYAALQQHLLSERLPFTRIDSPDESVEAVFRYLVG